MSTSEKRICHCLATTFLIVLCTSLHNHDCPVLEKRFRCFSPNLCKMHCKSAHFAIGVKSSSLVDYIGGSKRCCCCHPTSFPTSIGEPESEQQGTHIVKRGNCIHKSSSSTPFEIGLNSTSNVAQFRSSIIKLSCQRVQPYLDNVLVMYCVCQDKAAKANRGVLLITYILFSISQFILWFIH